MSAQPPPSQLGPPFNPNYYIDLQASVTTLYLQQTYYDKTEVNGFVGQCLQRSGGSGNQMAGPLFLANTAGALVVPFEPTQGFVLTSDASGNASWQASAGIPGTPVLNAVAYWSSASPPGLAGTNLQFNQTTGAFSFGGTVATTPPASSVVTTAFGASLTAGTAKQNSTGYDLCLNISVAVSSATSATLTLGVGTSSNPSTNTAVASFSAAAATFTLTAYVPNGFFVLVGTTGTVTVSSVTVVAMGI